MIATKHIKCPDCRGRGYHLWFKIVLEKPDKRAEQDDRLPCKLCDCTGKIEESDFIVLKLTGQLI